MIPCVGNGDVWELNDADVMRHETGVRGVMGARGLLANPVCRFSSSVSHCFLFFDSRILTLVLAGGYRLCSQAMRRHHSKLSRFVCFYLVQVPSL